MGLFRKLGRLTVKIPRGYDKAKTHPISRGFKRTAHEIYRYNREHQVSAKARKAAVKYYKKHYGRKPPRRHRLKSGSRSRSRKGRRTITIKY